MLIEDVKSIGHYLEESKLCCEIGWIEGGAVGEPNIRSSFFSNFDFRQNVMHCGSAKVKVESLRSRFTHSDLEGYI